ncbi:hypothetical protein [Chitiniphilus shinanonensis]|uniref:hypothetical protein n=1 Tax=Chitiniphilus shinanonensis TaxID=553088 RepID=UPI0012F850BF|nr:hypothetical protein [Chitiniphilus shinanonensis]
MNNAFFAENRMLSICPAIFDKEQINWANPANRPTHPDRWGNAGSMINQLTRLSAND